MKKNTNVCFDVMYLADLIQQPIPKLNFWIFFTNFLTDHIRFRKKELITNQ